MDFKAPNNNKHILGSFYSYFVPPKVDRTSYLFIVIYLVHRGGLLFVIWSVKDGSSNKFFLEFFSSLLGNNFGVNASTCVKLCGYFHVTRFANFHEIIENFICYGFKEDSIVAV